MRWREGPVQLASRLGIAPSTVHRILMDGGGWRYVGRLQGERNRSATPGKPKSKWRNPKLGYAFVHTVIDDRSRVAYTEVHDDETAVTAMAVLHRAVEWFADRGVIIERILPENDGAYRSHLWRDTCEALSITPKYTRPHRPQTNGKAERFHRTMADGGLMPAATPASRNDETHCPTGCTSTTTIDRRRPAATSRPSHE